jgi:ABC-type dipeptide/oligopeptide/nickel transport system permease component
LNVGIDRQHVFMLSYLIRRILLFIPTLIGATAVIFLLMAYAPINIVDVLLPPTGEMLPGQRAEREAYIEERYGLDKPGWVQYLKWLNNISPIGFHTWTREDAPVKKALEDRRQLFQQIEPELKAQHKDWSDRQVRKAMRNVARERGISPMPGDLRFDRIPLKLPDLGDSFVQSRPVAPIIFEALPVTVIIETVSLPLTIGIAVVTGIWAAKHRGKLQDVSTGTILLALYSIPVIWTGVMFIGFLANVQYVHAFPAAGLHSISADTMSFFPHHSASGWSAGYLLDTVWHLLLPVICLSYGGFAFYSKLTRTSLLETLGSDYVRTARAKGLSEGVVLYRHAFRNGLLPLITVAASFLPALITGSIVIETIFSLNGMGRLVITSLLANDRELFLSVSTIVLLLELVGFLLADVLYVIADPRVSYEG